MAACSLLTLSIASFSLAEETTLFPQSEDGYANGSVTYSNHQTGAHTWTDYGEITFSNCSGSANSSEWSAYGGAVYNEGATVRLNNNGAIDFSDNRAGYYHYYRSASYSSSSYYYRSYGGAIYNSGTFQVNGNDRVSFQNNRTYDTTSTSSSPYYYYYYGGAIYNTDTFSLMDNGDVTIQGNASSKEGGAIYNTGTFSIRGNGNVVFRQNWEGGNKRLRSIYHAGGTMTLDASAGHSITFYDSIYSASGTTLKLNESDSGDIVFTGATTEDDLRFMKGSAGTTAEIQNSRTSILYGTISLGGGRLLVRDEARLFTYDNIDLGEGASICLNNGVFGAGSSYTQTFENGTTLNIDESGTVNNNVTLQSGSTLQLDKAQATFNATLSIEDGVTLHLNDYRRGETYTLLTANSLSVNLDNIHIIGNRGTVSVVGNSLVLESDCERLHWSGSGYWSDDSSKLWTSSETGEQMTFASGDEVVFNNGGTINISGGVRPSAVEVSGSRAVTFRGDGSIIGHGQLTKEGSNTLTINTANRYSGGTLINGGTVKVGHEEALGTGEVSLGNGATLDMAGYAVANELHLVGNGVVKNGASFAGALVLESGTMSGDTLQIAQPATVESGTIENTLTGTGSLHKTTEGTVQLNGNNSYSGGTVVESGTLVLGHLNALGNGAVKLAGGTLDLNQLEGTFSNSITGTGGLTLNTQHHLSLAGDSSYSGGTILKNGTVTLLHDHALGTGTVELAGGTLDLNAQDIALDNALTGSGSLVVESEHTVRLNGANSYSGGTTLNKGTLTAGSATAFGTAAVTVNGGTLNMNSLAMTNAVVLNGGTLQGAKAFTGGITVTGDAVLETELNTAVQLESGTLSGTAIGNKSRVTAAGGELACDLEGRAALNVTGDTVFSGHATHIGGTTVESGSLTITGSVETDISVQGGELVIDTELADGQAISLEGGNMRGNVVVGDNTYVSVWEDAVIDGNVTVRDGVLENYDRDLRITGTLALESGYTEIGGSLHTGELTIAEGAELLHGSEGQVSLTATEGSTAVLTGVSLEEGCIRGTDAELRGSISGALIYLAKDVEISLENILLNADTRITDDPAVVSVNNTLALLNSTNTEVVAESLTADALTLYASGDAENTLTLNGGSAVVELSCAMFDSVTLSGSDLYLDLTALAVTLGDADAFSLTFTNGSLAALDADSLRLYATLDGVNYLAGYTAQQGGMADKVYFAIVPEPATATLSLLALAALAARRRRAA